VRQSPDRSGNNRSGVGASDRRTFDLVNFASRPQKAKKDVRKTISYDDNLAGTPKRPLTEMLLKARLRVATL